MNVNGSIIAEKIVNTFAISFSLFEQMHSRRSADQITIVFSQINYANQMVVNVAIEGTHISGYETEFAATHAMKNVHLFSGDAPQRNALR